MTYRELQKSRDVNESISYDMWICDNAKLIVQNITAAFMRGHFHVTSNQTTGNGVKLVKMTSASLFTLVFAKFTNFVWIRPE